MSITYSSNLLPRFGRHARQLLLGNVLCPLLQVEPVEKKAF